MRGRGSLANACVCYLSRDLTERLRDMKRVDIVTNDLLGTSMVRTLRMSKKIVQRVISVELMSRPADKKFYAGMKTSLIYKSGAPSLASGL